MKQICCGITKKEFNDNTINIHVASMGKNFVFQKTDKTQSSESSPSTTNPKPTIPEPAQWSMQKPEPPSEELRGGKSQSHLVKN